MSAFDLTPRLVRESKSNGKDTILFDKSLTGFGLRVHPSGRKVYIVQARIEGRSRRIAIARYGEMELAEARRRARDMLARIRAGDNPADDIQRERKTPTLREFANEYLRRYEPYWKPSGRKTVCIYLNARILPAFGRMPLDRIGPEDVAAWFDAASRDKPGAANRALEILRAMMFRAEEWGLRERGSNPLPRHREEPAQPRRAVPRRGRAGPARTRARRPRGGMARGRRRDPAAGAHRMPPQRSAQSALAEHRSRCAEPGRLEDWPARGAALPGAGDPNAFLFPRHAEGRGAYSLATCWRAVCADAKLGSLRLHDLRHTAASQAVMAGEGLPLVGRLLVHSRHRTTAGYAHLADAHLVEAAETVGSFIAETMKIGKISVHSRVGF